MATNNYLSRRLATLNVRESTFVHVGVDWPNVQISLSQRVGSRLRDEWNCDPQLLKYGYTGSDPPAWEKLAEANADWANRVNWRYRPGLTIVGVLRNSLANRMNFKFTKDTG